MGYWKKHRQHGYKKECKPYINLFGGSAGPGSTTTPTNVVFTECGPECGFDECRSDLLVLHEGVYNIIVSPTLATPGLRLLINGVIQPLGQTLFCLKCGDKIRIVNTSDGTITGISLTIFKVN